MEVLPCRTRSKLRSEASRTKAVTMLGVAGLVSAAGGASAAIVGPAENIPTENTAPVITLGEEEISDVSLATFYVFDKENAGTHFPGVQLARGCRGCRGCAVRRGCTGRRGCAGHGLRRVQGLRRVRLWRVGLRWVRLRRFLRVGGRFHLLWLKRAPNAPQQQSPRLDRRVAYSTTSSARARSPEYQGRAPWPSSYL